MMDTPAERLSHNVPTASMLVRRSGRSRIFTRRRFLKASVAVAIGGGVYWSTRKQVRVGIVGCGIRGASLAQILRMSRFYPYYGKVVAVCDVNLPRARALADREYAFEAGKPEVYSDYQKLLQRHDVEAVVVATPDHWHANIALAAVAAGKAVYSEKPLTHSIGDGKRLVSAVQRANALLQCGLQQRCDVGFRTAAELVRNGRLGTINRVTVTVADKGLAGGPFSTERIPSGLNWDAWLGPAPHADYCSERYDNWHEWHEYGGGEITNWGVHHVDIAQWAIGAERTGPLEIHGSAHMPNIEGGYNEPRQFHVRFRFPGNVELILKSIPKEDAGVEKSGITFEGDKGQIYVTRSGYQGQAFAELGLKPLPPDAIRLHPDSKASSKRIAVQHMYYFLRAIREGGRPVSDVASAHRSATTCNLANISLRLQRKLMWDPSREDFIDDPEASSFIDPPKRQPYG